MLNFVVRKFTGRLYKVNSSKVSSYVTVHCIIFSDTFKNILTFM